MVKVKQLLSRASALSSAVALTAASILPVVLPSAASAASLTGRSLELSNSLGGATSVKHTFTFTVPAGGNIGSVEFEYCDSPVPTVACAQSAGASGVSVSSATIDSQSGITGWSIGTNTSSKIQIAKGSAAANGSDTEMTVTFAGITNPTFGGYSTQDSNSFYVRIRTYSTTSYTTARDTGVVASATTSNIDLTAIVRETLYFCVGTTTGGNTDCTTTSGTAVGLGDADNVLSLTSATTNRDHSYFRLSTNGYLGTTVKYLANHTLKDGTNEIDAVGSETAFTTPGTTEQFGLAIDDEGNTKCAVGGASADTNGVAAAAGYDEGDADADGTAKYNYANNTPTTIASAPGIVDWATCKVGYAANITPTTPAGVYTASINFIAVPKY